MNLVMSVNEPQSAEVGNISRVRPPPIIRRGVRKKTLSLNPEEREALENLVEEVILEGGIGDSPSSDEDDGTESDNKQQANGSRTSNKNTKTGAQGDGPKGKPDALPNRKYYPGQLKVALKHMSEIPPRFSRKLRKAERYLEMNGLSKQATSAVIAEEDEEDIKKEHSPGGGNLSEEKRDKEKEKLKTREVQVKEVKKDIRTLLNDMNQYSDETTVGITTEESSITDTSNVLTIDVSSSLSNRAGPISCEDLERELLNRANDGSSVELYGPQPLENNYSDSLGNLPFNQSLIINKLENSEAALQFSEYSINNQDIKKSIDYPLSFQTSSVLYSNPDEVTQELDTSSSYYTNNMPTSIISAQSHYSSGNVYIHVPNYTSPTSQLDGGYIDINTQAQMMSFGTSRSNDVSSSMVSYPLPQDMAMSISMAYSASKSSDEPLMQNPTMPNVQIPPPFHYLSLGQGIHTGVSHLQGANSTLPPPPFHAIPPNVQQMTSIQGMASSMHVLPPKTGIPIHMQQMLPNMHSIQGPSQIQGMAQFRGALPLQNQQTLPPSTYHQQFSVPPPPFPSLSNPPLVVMPNMFRVPPPNLVPHSVPPYPPPPLPPASSEATSHYAFATPALQIHNSSFQANSGTAGEERTKVNGWIHSMPSGEVSQNSSRGLNSPSDSVIRPHSANDRFTRMVHSNSPTVGGRKFDSAAIDAKAIAKSIDANMIISGVSSSGILTSHGDTHESKSSIDAAPRDLKRRQPYPGKVKSAVRFAEDVTKENRPTIATVNNSPEVPPTLCNEAIPGAASLHSSDLGEMSVTSTENAASSSHRKQLTERPEIVPTDSCKYGIVDSITVSTACTSVSALSTDSSIVSTVANANTLSESLNQLSVSCDGVTPLPNTDSSQQFLLCNGSVPLEGRCTPNVCASAGCNHPDGLSCDCGASYVELRIGEELVCDLNRLFGQRLSAASAGLVRIPTPVARLLHDSLLESESKTQ